MRIAFALAALALAACEAPPPLLGPPAVPSERVEAFVIAARQIGCTIDPVEHEAMHRAGFTDAEMGEISGQLLAEGRAQRTTTGALVIVTEDCV